MAFPVQARCLRPRSDQSFLSRSCSRGSVFGLLAKHAHEERNRTLSDTLCAASPAQPLILHGPDGTQRSFCYPAASGVPLQPAHSVRGAHQVRPGPAPLRGLPEAGR